MILKLLVVAFIVYWIIRSALNLWKAVSGDTHSGNSGRERFEDKEIRREVNGVKYEQTWTVGQKTTRAQRPESVEDARFRDV